MKKYLILLLIPLLLCGCKKRVDEFAFKGTVIGYMQCTGMVTSISEFDMGYVLALTIPDSVGADFTLPDADGNMHSMKELLKGHDYLMIDFWASWCKPCRRGLPFMKDYAKKYEKDNLAMLNVSIDKKREDWIKANNDENLPWTSLLCRMTVLPE